MRVLVNGLSVRALSGEHVLRGHLRQLAAWTLGEHAFLLLHDPAQRHWVRGFPANVQPVCVDRPLARWWRRAIWETVALPRVLADHRVDLVFTPSGTVLARCPAPQVSLALNPWCMVPEVHRGFAERRKAAFQRRAYGQAVRKAALMCYTSEYLQGLYRANAGGTVERAGRIVYCAADEEVREYADRAGLSTARQPDLIVSVSAMAPWKGADVLVDALALLHRRKLRARLCLVGPWPDQEYERSVRAKIAALGLGQYVTVAGRVTKEELCRHLAEARVFCLMSRCESFGIPAVEAQVFGTPVVGSSTCAMPEIGGAGGLFCDPDDVSQTAAHLGRMLEDGPYWQEVSDRARQNAGRFRWEKVSRPLLDMFSVGRAAPGHVPCAADRAGASRAVCAP